MDESLLPARSRVDRRRTRKVLASGTSDDGIQITDDDNERRKAKRAA